jgi:hypothetical protein
MPYSGYSEGKNKAKPISGNEIEQLWQVLQSGTAKDCQSKSDRLLTSFHYTAQNIGGRLILDFLSTPELELIHLVRFLLILDEFLLAIAILAITALNILTTIAIATSTTLGFVS